MRIPLITRKLTAIIYDFLADPSTKGENNDQNFFYRHTLSCKIAHVVCYLRV